METSSLEEKTKKLYLLFFGLIISYIPLIIIERIDFFKEILEFEKLTRAISKIIAIIPFFISKKNSNENPINMNNNNSIIKKNCQDYIILIFFPIIYFISKLMN